MGNTTLRDGSWGIQGRGHPLPAEDPYDVTERSHDGGGEDQEAVGDGVIHMTLTWMAAEDKAIELDIHEWSRILLALCGTRAKKMAVRKHQLRTAKRIANHLAEALRIDAPSFERRK